jgi:hypothetical protein
MRNRGLKLRDLLPGRAPKTPGFGISTQYYLSVLTNTASLPAPIIVANPKGESGGVPGFAIPMKVDAGKEELGAPMIRGRYGFVSPDQKTALEATVVSLDEAGFQPDPFLASPAGLELDNEVRARIKAAWNLVQLVFKSYDPAVYPAVDFMLAVAKRLAELTDGVVADPLSQVYRLPADLVTERKEGEQFSVQDVVAVRTRADGARLHVFTLGLQKFGLPELEIAGVPKEIEDVATRFLLGAGKTQLKGVKMEPGDKLGSPKLPLRVAEGGLDRRMWEGVTVLELIPEKTGPIEESLLMWSVENP